MLFVEGYREEIEKYIKLYKKEFYELKGSKILITGAAGLIGSYFIDLLICANKLLNTDIKVVALDYNKNLLNKRFPDEFDNTIEKYYDDINCKVPDISGIDYVIHAASHTSPTDYALKPIETIRTNVIGAMNLLDFCIDTKVKKFLFCSSVEAYGINNGDVDEFTEDYSGYVNCNTLRAGYPSAKRVSEALCNAYAGENTDFTFNIARIGRIYGPTVIEGDAKAPSQFLDDAVNSRDIVLKSDGMQEFSYGYVGDCATAILFILTKGTSGEAYNIADPKSRIRLRDFASIAAKAGGTQIVFQAQSAVEAKGYSKVNKAVMNMKKLLSLGWSACYNAQDGILRTVNYLKAERKING